MAQKLQNVLKEKVEIHHYDEILEARRTGVAPVDGWYRYPSGGRGAVWVYVKDAKLTTHVVIDETDSEPKGYEWEVWIGYNDGDSETLSYHKYLTQAENVASKWIREHPRGEDG